MALDEGPSTKWAARVTSARLFGLLQCQAWQRACADNSLNITRYQQALVGCLSHHHHHHDEVLRTHRRRHATGVTLQKALLPRPRTPPQATCVCLLAGSESSTNMLAVSLFGTLHLGSLSWYPGLTKLDPEVPRPGRPDFARRSNWAIHVAEGRWL